MLLIFDRDENLTAILEQGNKSACPYYEGKVKSVLNGEQTIVFRAPYDHEDAKKIKEHGYIARKNKFGQWQLFLITEIVEVHSDTFLEIEVFGESNFIELDSIIIEDLFFDRKTPDLVLPQLLSGTRWTVGSITGTGTHDLTIKNQSVLEALQLFRERWGVELTFRIEVAGNKISKRIIDCSNTKGAWKGKRFEYRHDLAEITRTIDAKHIKTGLYAFGATEQTAGEEASDPLTIANVTWSKPTNPANKPLGQKWIADDEATAIWGKPLQAGSVARKPLFGVFQDNEAKTQDELINSAWAYLQTINKPLITYSAKTIDLFRILDIESEIVELGDTAAVIDRELNNLVVQARIIEIEEDLDNPENDLIVLGNFAPAFTDVAKQLEDMEKRIGSITETDLSNVLTQDDLANLATKDELTPLATKTELESYAPKTDLQNYAPLSKLNDYATITSLADYLKAGATINPEWIDTAFEFARDKIATGNGTVILNEGDGLLIVDNPANPQKAIKLQAGQIALANSYDAATQTFNWRNFGTGEGWLSDLVETGFLKFDRSRGGSLQLGGEVIGTQADGKPLFENGVLSVSNSEGDIVAELSGDYGGFGDLRIDTLRNTQNVVFSTFNATPRVEGDNIIYYVDPYDGNDMNDGSDLYPLLTIQEAINRLPKYLDRNVRIRFSFGLLADSEITIGGFMGTGEIHIEKWNIPIRFVRDWAAGNNLNRSSHFNDMRVYEDDGSDNGLLWRIDSLNYPERLTTNSANKDATTNPLKNVGDYSISTFFDGGYLDINGVENPLYVQAYLNGEKTLKRVLMWHYYADGRTYKKTKLQVSQDNTRFYTVFDSQREGEYAETSAGKVHYTDRAYLKGNFLIKQNSVSVNINNLFIDSSENSKIPMLANTTKDVTIRKCVIFGNTAQLYAVYALKSRLSIKDSEVNTASRAGIAGAYGAQVEIENVKGSGFPVGHLSHADSVVSGGGTGLSATTQKLAENGGYIAATWTATTGIFSPVKIVEKVVAYWNSDSQSYDVGNGYWRTNDKEVQQGAWGEYGLYRGLWFFGTELRNKVVGKEIVRVRVYVTRANSSGYTSAVNIYLRTHGHATKPSGAPTVDTSTYKAVALTRGQSAWVDCTNEFKAAFNAGTAYGIGIYTSSYAASNYARMTVSCKIEITYKEAI